MAMVAVVLLNREDRTGSDAPSAAANEATSPEATAARPRFQAQQTVCQGVLHLPNPGEPRVFPAIYTQHATALGIDIVAGAGVSNEAIEKAKATITAMFKANGLSQPLAEQGVYVIIAESGQGVLDLPEFACLEEQFGSGFFDSVCGIADRADYPVATVNEDDLLGNRSGPCRGLNILYHELGHLVQNWSIGPADWFDLKQYYQEAISAGTYDGMYAAKNPNEYFAEATQAYFLKTDVRVDRDWLARRDPKLFALLEQLYGKP